MKIRNGNSTKKMTAHPSKYPQKRFKAKRCRWCNIYFNPIAPSNHYCSIDCKDNGNTNKYYLKKYGVSLDWVLKCLERQNYCCAICKTKGFKMRETHKSTLNLDHCHETGKVRGLLCHNCNRALGLLQDNPVFLRRAAEYVEGATTIPKGSRGKCPEAHDTSDGDDIV